MNKNDDTTTKKLLTIPLILFCAFLISGIMTAVLEVPANRGTIYSIFALIWLFLMYFAPLPCLILSICGFIKVKKQKAKKRMLVLSVTEMIFGTIFTAYFCWSLFMIIFVTGPSV